MSAFNNCWIQISLEKRNSTFWSIKSTWFTQNLPVVIKLLCIGAKTYHSTDIYDRLGLWSILMVSKLNKYTLFVIWPKYYKTYGNSRKTLSVDLMVWLQTNNVLQTTASTYPRPCFSSSGCIFERRKSLWSLIQLNVCVKYQCGWNDKNAGNKR